MELQTFPRNRFWAHEQPFWFFKDGKKLDTRIVTWSVTGECDYGVLCALVRDFYEKKKIVHLNIENDQTSSAEYEYYLKFHPMPSINETMARDLMFRYWLHSGNSLENITCRATTSILQQPEDLKTDIVRLPIIDFDGESKVYNLKMEFSKDFAPDTCPSCKHSIESVWKFFNFLSNCALMSSDNQLFPNSMRISFVDGGSHEDQIRSGLSRYGATFVAARVNRILLGDSVVWSA